MPTYDFRCKTCDHRFEITRPFTAEGTPTCPSCGEEINVVKVFPKVGISFKGSGFYKTDSRGSSKSSDGGSKSTSESSSSSSDSSSSSSSSNASTSSGGSSSSSGGSSGSSASTAAKAS